MGDHLGPQFLGHAFTLNLDEVAVGVQLGIAVIVDFKPPGYHLQGRGHVGFGGGGLVRDLPQPFGAVAGGAVLGAANVVRSERAMDVGGQPHLNTGVACLDAVGGAVIESDPIGEDVAGVEPLDQEQRLRHGGKPLFPLDFPYLGFKSGPGRNAGVNGNIRQQVLIIREMGGVDGDGGDSGLEHGRHFNPGGGQILIVLDAVMIGVNGNRNSDAHFIAERINNAGHIPIVDCAVGFLTPFRLGDFDDYRRIGALGGVQDSADDEIVASVAGHGNRFSLGKHGPVDDLAADDKGLGIGEKLADVGGAPNLKSFFEICRVTHFNLPLSIVDIILQLSHKKAFRAKNQILFSKDHYVQSPSTSGWLLFFGSRHIRFNIYATDKTEKSGQKHGERSNQEGVAQSPQIRQPAEREKLRLPRRE